jgi:hypothetical protein
MPTRFIMFLVNVSMHWLGQEGVQAQDMDSTKSCLFGRKGTVQSAVEFYVFSTREFYTKLGFWRDDGTTTLEP